MATLRLDDQRQDLDEGFAGVRYAVMEPALACVATVSLETPVMPSVQAFAGTAGPGVAITPPPAVRVGAEVLVNTATFGDQSGSRVATLSNGGFVVIWIDRSQGDGGATGDTSGIAVKAQIFAITGEPSGPEILVNTATAGNQWIADITSLANGGFVVTWTDTSQGVGGTTGDNGSWAVKAQIFSAEGATIGTEILVNSATEGEQARSEITALPDGGFVVTWQDRSQGVGGASGDTSGTAVKAQVFSEAGTRVGTEILVNTATESDQQGARITPLANGGFVITWEDASDGIGGAPGDDGSIEPSAVKAQVFTAAGQPVGTEILVNTATDFDQYGQEITALANGGFVITWGDASEGVGGAPGDDSAGAVKAQVFSANGSRVGSEILVNTETNSVQYDPKITALSDGGFVVSWTDFSGTSGDTNGAIKAQVFDAAGARQGAEILVNTATIGEQYGQHITSLANGGFVVTWSDNIQVGVPSPTYTVKAQVFSADGAKVGPEISVSTATTQFQSNGAVTALPNGGFVMTWEAVGAAGDGNGYGVKAQVFNVGLSATEQVSLDLKNTGLSVTDPDAGDVLTVTLSTDYGLLTVSPGISGAVVAGSGTATVTITGTAAQIHALLNSDGSSVVSFLAHTDTPPASALVTLAANDGQGGIATTNMVLPIQGTPDLITGANDLTGFGPSVAFAENTVNAAPQLLDPDVVFIDSDGDYDGGVLTLSGLLAEDTVSVRDQGAGPGQIGLSGSNVTWSGVVIGVLSGGVGETLTILFNAAATSDAIDALIQNLTYANASDAPTASRDLVINVVDAAGNDLSGPMALVERMGADNPFDGVETDGDSAPTLVDLDGDGDVDLVVGGQDGALRYFENSGGGFIERTGAGNPFSGFGVVTNSAPTFVDLDDDGDLDAVVGGANGKLRTFINEGGEFVLLAGRANPFDGVDVGENSVPTFVDMDGDGDADAVVGGQNGRLIYLESTGAGFIERTGVESPFYDLDVGFESAPAFADIDRDGDLDAVVGGANGVLRYFEQTGAGFTRRTGGDNPFDGLAPSGNVSPALADVDGDGDLDLLLGSIDGSLTWFENTSVRGQVITVNVIAEAEGRVITGTAAGEVLTGAVGDDVIHGLDGDDVLYGADGDDILLGGAGDDVLSGGDGVDTASYADAAAGVTARLAITGRGQNTVGAGRDTLSGIENLSGSAFDDYFTGDAGDNLLSDTLGGDDRFIAGAGNDTLMVERSGGGAATEITLRGGDGDDVMRFDGHGRYADAVTFEGQDGDDVISALGALRANVTAGAGNDTVTVDTLSGSFVVRLGSGSDTLVLAAADGGFAGSTANLVRDFATGAGGDVVDLSAWLAGGALTNHTPGSNPFLDGHMRLVQAGNDTLLQVDRDGGSDGFVTVLTLQNTQTLNFTAYNLNGLAPLPASVEGGAGADALTGTAGMDVLNGNGGDDLLTGLAGADVLNGGAGNDVLDGGAGDDVLNGGSGSQGDTATYATASAGVRINLATSGLQDTGGSGFDSLTAIEHLVGSAFTDELRGDGLNNRLSDTLGGDDFLRGEAGDDVILIARSGGAAATTVRLNGGDGADALTFSGAGRYIDTVTLEGEGGNDVITVSGAGTITVDAGAGDDTVIYDTLGGAFRITLGAGTDTVRLAGTGGQFQASTDKLLRDFTAGAGGDIVDLSVWLAGGALTNYTGGGNPFADGHMRLVQAGTRTLLQVDRDGGGDGYQTVLTFANTTAGSFTAANFNGIDPTGVAPAPLELADKAFESGPQVLPGRADDFLVLPGELKAAFDEPLVLPGAALDGLAGRTGVFAFADAMPLALMAAHESDHLPGGALDAWDARHAVLWD